MQFPDAQLTAADLVRLRNAGETHRERVALGLAGDNDVPHLPAIHGTRRPLGVGDAVKPAVVFIGQIEGQVRLGPAQLQLRGAGRVGRPVADVHELHAVGPRDADQERLVRLEDEVERVRACPRSRS